MSLYMLTKPFDWLEDQPSNWLSEVLSLLTSSFNWLLMLSHVVLVAGTARLKTHFPSIILSHPQRDLCVS